MTSLCKYKNIFGIPGQDLHSYRLFNIAIVDMGLTIIFAYIVSFFFKFKFIYTLIIFLTIGIVMHRLFCVRTTIDKFLFNND